MKKSTCDRPKHALTDLQLMAGRLGDKLTEGPNGLTHQQIATRTGAHRTDVTKLLNGQPKGKCEQLCRRIIGLFGTFIQKFNRTTDADADPADLDNDDGLAYLRHRASLIDMEKTLIESGRLAEASVEIGGYVSQAQHSARAYTGRMVANTVTRLQRILDHEHAPKQFTEGDVRKHKGRLVALFRAGMRHAKTEKDRKEHTREYIYAQVNYAWVFVGILLNIWSYVQRGMRRLFKGVQRQPQSRFGNWVNLLNSINQLLCTKAKADTRRGEAQAYADEALALAERLAQTWADRASRSADREERDECLACAHGFAEAYLSLIYRNGEDQIPRLVKYWDLTGDLDRVNELVNTFKETLLPPPPLEAKRQRKPGADGLITTCLLALACLAPFCSGSGVPGGWSEMLYCYVGGSVPTGSAGESGVASPLQTWHGAENVSHRREQPTRSPEQSHPSTRVTVATHSERSVAAEIRGGQLFAADVDPLPNDRLNGCGSFAKSEFQTSQHSLSGSDERIGDEYAKAAGGEGALRAELMAVVAQELRERVYLSPTPVHEAIALADEPPKLFEAIESPPANNARTFGCFGYGLDRFDKLFTNRQLVALKTLSDLVAEACERIMADAADAGWTQGVLLEDGGARARANAGSIHIVERRQTLAASLRASLAAARLVARFPFGHPVRFAQECRGLVLADRQVDRLSPLRRTKGRGTWAINLLPSMAGAISSSQDYRTRATVRGGSSDAYARVLERIHVRHLCSFRSAGVGVVQTLAAPLAQRVLVGGSGTTSYALDAVGGGRADDLIDELHQRHTEGTGTDATRWYTGDPDANADQSRSANLAEVHRDDARRAPLANVRPKDGIRRRLLVAAVSERVENDLPERPPEQPLLQIAHGDGRNFRNLSRSLKGLTLVAYGDGRNFAAC